MSGHMSIRDNADLSALRQFRKALTHFREKTVLNDDVEASVS